MAYRRILVPLDGSKLSEQALRQAVQVAAPGAHIQIVSIMADNRTNEVNALSTAIAYGQTETNRQWPPINGLENPHDERARERYLREVSEWLTEAGYKVGVLVQPGSVIEMILKLAKGYDCIVMATHGRTGTAKMVLGSVTESVLRAAPCPVLVVPPQTVSAH